MPNNNSERGKTFSRRTALSGAAGAISVGVLSGSVVGKGEDRVSIPVLISGDKVKRRERVAKKWWNHVKRVRRVHANVEQNREEKEGVRSVHITIGDQTISGRRRMAVGLRYHPDKFDGGTEDEQKDGVKIKKEAESKQGYPGMGCYNDSDFSNVPGGVACEGDDGEGTTGFRVYHNDDGQYEMVTAGHLFDACTDSVRGQSFYQNHEGEYQDYAGSLEHPHNQEDWVTIKDDSSYKDYTFEVKTESTREPIEGAVTNYEVIMSEGTPIYQMGKATGETAGTLEDYKVTGDGASGTDVACVDFNGEGVRIDSGAAYFGEGDSGGPIYQRFNGGGVGIVSLGALGYTEAGTHSCDGGGQLWSDCEGISSEHISNNGFDFIS